MKILGNSKKGILFVISAPAGTGKSTLAEMLVDEFPDQVTESCSSTTRPPRPGEVQGRHYDFLSPQEFTQRVERGEFLEHVEVFGHLYGTRLEEVERLQKAGKHVLLVIDTQGALQIRERGIPATFIFLAPPSMEELRRRLFKRKTEEEAMIEQRLKWAELELSRRTLYDYTIVNEELEISYQILRSILIAEEHKNRRST